MPDVALEPQPMLLVGAERDDRGVGFDEPIGYLDRLQDGVHPGWLVYQLQHPHGPAAVCYVQQLALGDLSVPYG
ncbi:hypothetical protein GCM10010522_30260 [Kribbella solani]